MGDVVPEGQRADGARLLPHRAPDVSFVTSQSHWCRFQIRKMTYRGRGDEEVRGRDAGAIGSSWRQMTAKSRE